MRVLYIVNDLSGTNGWSTYAHNIIDLMTSLGHEVQVSAHEKTPSHKPRVLINTLEYDPMECTWNPVKIFRTARQLSSVIKEFKPDVIHVLAEPYLMPFAFLFPKVPVVLTVHGTYSYVPAVVNGWRRLLSKVLYFYAYKKVVSVIAVSEATKKRFLAFHTRVRCLQVIYNSFQKPEIEGVLQKDKEKGIQVITVGAVKARKGVREAIEALSSWANERKSLVSYNVVGSFEESSSYCDEVYKLAQRKRSPYFQVKFHGQVTEQRKAELLNQASLYIHLEPILGNNVEGFGIGIIEAAAYQVPALVSRKSATREAVQEGATGYCVDVDSHDEVVKALDALLIEKKVTPSSLIDWANQHTPDKKIKEIEEVYKNSVNIYGK